MKTAYELGKEGISKQADGLHNWLGRFHGWMQGGGGGGLYNKVTQGIKNYTPNFVSNSFGHFAPGGAEHFAQGMQAHLAEEPTSIFSKLSPEGVGHLGNTLYGGALGGLGGGVIGALHGLKSGWDEGGLWGATKGLVTGGIGGAGIGAIAGGLGGRFAGDYAREGIKDFRRGSKLTRATRKLRDHKKDFNTATGERFAEGDSTPLSMKPTLEAEVGAQEPIGLLNAHKAVRGV